MILFEDQYVSAPDSLWQGLISSRNAHMDDMQTLAAGIENQSALLAANRTTAAAALNTQNNGISVHAVYEQNRKTINRILLSYIQRSASHFTSTEQSALELIAQQCPLSGGKAVFDARALLSISRDSLVWYDNTCTGGQQFRAVENTSTVPNTASTELFPNPASSEVTIRWGMPLEADGRLDLYDTLGRLHHSAELESGRSEYILSLETLEKGLYYVDVQINASRSTLKLVINP